MHLTPMLLVPGLIASVPSLPSPTPGLPREGQEINFAALNGGVLVKTATVDGHEYSVRGISDRLLLYNHLGHVILIAKITQPECRFALGAHEGNPYPGEWPTGEVILDGETYILALVANEQGLILACYNGEGHIVFAMLDPDPNQIMVPRAPKPI
jgi:hypothetical protein